MVRYDWSGRTPVPWDALVLPLPCILGSIHTAAELALHFEFQVLVIPNSHAYKKYIICAVSLFFQSKVTLVWNFILFQCVLMEKFSCALADLEF